MMFIPQERFQALVRVLNMYTGATLIVFAEQKDVDHMSEKLTLLNFDVSSYHGDLSPTARDRALKKFVEKKTSILLLTDIPNQLEGLPKIDLVLFSIIPKIRSYIQRIKRLESIIEIKR